ncbi:sigma-70 family RNA polymerase sigma factor [Piscinibacter sp.]|uniref:sigma-70 family RNA polymerase sigma factor n=1 Tax=Piscinibacter sp. TaxID=1903157 RepID=UPI0039E34BA7
MTVAGIALPLHRDVESLYAHHHGWLKVWLRRRLGDPFTAADLAHDIFVRLLEREVALALQEPRAFLTIAAQRAVISHWRRQQLERAYLDALARVPEALVPSEEERAILLETLLEIDRLLDGLPPPVKRCFLLTQLDGLNHLEVAQAMEVSVTTVKRYLVKAAAHCYFADALPG